MLDEAAIAALTDVVVWSAFGIAFLMGALMSRTDFCTMGAVADIVNIGDWTRMRMWLGAIGVAILGTQTLAAAGLVDLSRTIYTGAPFPLVSYVVGGLMF